MAKKSDKLRDMEKPTILGGIELDRETLTPVRRQIEWDGKSDYGCDPLGHGKYKMVPSGDIVDYEEKENRLRPLRK